MSNFRRRLYGAMVRLHPAEFRDEFGREMELDFEDALGSYGAGALLLDGLRSLGRQWAVCIVSGGVEQRASARPSLLAGQYVMIRDERFSVIELGRGLVASVISLGLVVSGLGGTRRTAIDLPVAYASSSTPGPGRDANPGPVGESPEFELSQSADASFSTASEIRPSRGSGASIGLGEFAEIQPKPELLLFHLPAPLSYEVATIKPIGADAAGSMVKLPPGVSLSPLSIRRYIMDAYGAIYAAQIVGGPDWLNKDAYQIHGKIPDDLEAAFQKMTTQERVEQDRGMRQSLLAERFHLQAHFETRILPVYEIVPAKGGLKITEVSAPPERKPGDPPVGWGEGDPLPPGTSMSTFNYGLYVLNGRAIKLDLLARIVGGYAGDRPIVNHTGFTGYFDVTDLAWAPLGDAVAESAPDAPSLSVALERTLGVKIVPTKAPIEVLVIDQIERASGN